MQIDLQNYEIISFDIFDTLIKRKYTNPKDLFKHVGAIFKDSSFALKRIKAEINARKSSKEEDITIDEIYAKLPTSYEKYKDQEKLLEINNSFANPEIMKIYQQAKKLNKKVIATSDMYLDKNTITSILNHTGYINLDKVYISGEYKKTKSSGKLFEIIIKDFKTKPEKILHIGDNYKADYLSATKKGLKALHYQEKNFLKDKKFNNFLVENRDLEKSCLYALFNKYYKKTQDYWHRFGFAYGGPLCCAFITWIYKQLKEDNFSDILFISRDAWILKQVYDVLYPNNKIKSHYIYASRQICQNVDKKEYRKYLDKENISKIKISLVDTITYKYTAQKFLQQFFTNKITGFYWRLLKQSQEYKAFSFEKKDKVNLYEFMEFIMTSPENPPLNIKNGKIIYNISNEYEETRKDIYLRVSQGILDFTKEYKNLYKNEILNIDNYFVINWLNSFFSNLNKEDIKNLSTIYHTSRHDEKEEYLPILPEDYYVFSNLDIPPFLYRYSPNNTTIKVKLFNKLTILKRILYKNKKVYYFCRIPIYLKYKK